MGFSNFKRYMTDATNGTDGHHGLLLWCDRQAQTPLMCSSHQKHRTWIKSIRPTDIMGCSTTAPNASKIPKSWNTPPPPTKEVERSVLHSRRVKRHEDAGINAVRDASLLHGDFLLNTLRTTREVRPWILHNIIIPMLHLGWCCYSAYAEEYTCC